MTENPRGGSRNGRFLKVGPRVRIRLAPAASQVRTCLSRGFAFIPGSPARGDRKLTVLVSVTRRMSAENDNAVWPYASGHIMLSREIRFSPSVGDLEYRRVETLAPRPLFVVQSGSGAERARRGGCRGVSAVVYS